MYICLHVCRQTYIGIYVCMYVHKYTYCTHTYVVMDKCMCTCMYVYVYMLYGCTYYVGVLADVHDSVYV